MKQYNRYFTPENDNEELLILAGRVEALAAYLERVEYPNKHTIAAMLGISLQEGRGNAKNNSTNGNIELD